MEASAATLDVMQTVAPNLMPVEGDAMGSAGNWDETLAPLLGEFCPAPRECFRY